MIMKSAAFKFFVCLFILFAGTSLHASYETQAVATELSGDKSDKYVGKRKRNTGSPASKRAISRQPKSVQKSIKRNEKRNKKQLRYRNKKQRRQKRFSSTACFR